MTLPIADRKPGEYPLEELPEGWVNAEVTFRRSNGVEETRVEILNLETQLRYGQEPMSMIAFKCFELFCVSIFYFLGYAVFHLIRLPVATIVNLSPTVLFKELCKAVQIPFYFLAIEFAALYGIFKPLQGRAFVGAIESSFHDGKTRQQAEQYKKGSWPFWANFCEAISVKENPTALFIAFCMQPLGARADAHIVSVKELSNPPQVFQQIPQAV